MIGEAIRICTAEHPCTPRPVAIPDQLPLETDVATLDGIIRAWYEIVSGPKGQPRAWGRDRTLYSPEVRFLKASGDAQRKPRATLYDHQGYVNEVDPWLKKHGFFEQEIHRVTRRFGNTAHVYSTYESREKAEGPVVARGINSMELFFDGMRWWIMYAQWQEETPDLPIPKEYLP